MAESIALLFGQATWVEVDAAVSKIASKYNKNRWRFPVRVAEQTLILYEYDSWFSECESTEKDFIKRHLGSKPSAVLCIELRRTVQSQACDDATFFCNFLLEQFDGIIDDGVGNFWNTNEINKDKDFLKVYRTRL